MQKDYRAFVLINSSNFKIISRIGRGKKKAKFLHSFIPDKI